MLGEQTFIYSFIHATKFCHPEAHSQTNGFQKDAQRYNEDGENI